MSLQSATARVAAIQARVGAIPGRVTSAGDFQGVLGGAQRHAGVEPLSAEDATENLDNAVSSYGAASLGADQSQLAARLMGTGTQTLGSMVAGGQSLGDILTLLTGNNASASAIASSTAVGGVSATSGRGAQVVSGHEVGSGYGNRIHPIAKTERFHHGVDIGAPSGTPIRSYADGVVSFAGPRGGYGNLVIVDHGGGIETRYAHQSEIAVKVGDGLVAGQTLGLVGSTGSSTAPHLHFEMRQNGSSVDPTPYLRSTGMSVRGDE